MITTALNLLFYSFITIFILFLLGFGLTSLLIPDKLKSYALWLSPWFSMFFLIFFLVIFSLFGFSVNQVSPFLIIVLFILDIIVILKRKFEYTIGSKENIVITIFIVLSIVFNSSPLIKKVKLLTTISLGNNDVIVYATLPDYFVNHTIVNNYNASINDPLKPAADGTNGMIRANFRWGSPIIVSFFLNIFKLKGYQYVYLFEVILFGLTIPLVYLLFKLLYKKSFYGLFLCLFLFSFNVNLLYILYNDFLGQIFFWGIEVFLFIFFFSYFSSNEIKKNDFSKYDFIIGLTTSVLFFSYHEAAIFIIVPIVLFLIINFLNRTKVVYYLQTLIRIFFIAVVTSFLSIIHAIRIDFFQAGSISDSTIGWQLFRSKIPYANPFEAMGFYSIHSFEPMPLIIALLLSFFVILIFSYGFLKSKYKTMSLCFLVIYGMFYIWTAVIGHNFWAYDRVLTYTLPLIIVLFSIGVTSLFENKKTLGAFFLIIFLGAELFSSLKLNKRFLKEYLAVDSSLVSLQELNNNSKINKPIYTEQTITGLINLWRQFWTDYFLFPNKSIYTPLNIDKTKNLIIDNSLILVSKPSSLNNSPPKILFNKTVWKNKYYVLGSLCNSDQCLLKNNNDLSKIIIGENEFEDSLLLTGWDIREGYTRWANEKESTLRLTVKDIVPSMLTVEVLSLKPQEITIYIDKDVLGKISIGTEWNNYSIPINYPLNRGVHKIKFVYTKGYRPIDIIPGSLDSRTLYVNFKKIALE